MRSPARAGAGYALLTALCIALTGCSVLASDQSIRPGLGVGRVDPNSGLQVAPPGPRTGADPNEIVRGFLQALAGSGGDFVTAREFLTGPAERDWSPESRTLVFRGGAQISEPSVQPAPGVDEQTADTASTPASPTTTGPLEGQDQVVLRVSASVWAEVDRSGRYRELATAEQREADLTLVLVEGEWRIRTVEADFGRWLGTADFERLYDAYAVHYVSTGERVLIPDIRYVPTDRVATRLSQLQLGAAPEYMAGAVRKDIPESARLAVGAVPVLGGVASVDLRGEGIGSDPTARANLWAQFVATLTQVRGVDRVEITLEGNPLEIPDIDRVSSLSDLGFTTPATASRAEPLIRQGSLIGRPVLRPQTEDPPDKPAPAPPSEQRFPEIEPQWQHLALSYSGDELAGVSTDAMSRWRGEIRYDVPRFATDLGRPCYDRYNTLWVGGLGTVLPRDRLFAVNAAASPADPVRSAAQVVPVTWLEDRRVLACHVSPQGTRIAIINDAGEGTPPRLDIGTVIRQVNGLPIGVAGPQPVADQFVAVTDAVWLTETSLGIMAESASNAPPMEPQQGQAEADPAAPASGAQPWLLTVGGRASDLPDLPDGQWMTSTGGERNLIITAALSDRVYVRVGPQWVPAQDQGSQVIVAAR